MGLRMWHHPSEGTGRSNFANAFMQAVAAGNLDRDIGNVGINFISGNTRRGYFNVLRVDGVYYDQPRMSQNAPIAKSILSHDLVVYQSQFSKDMAERMLGVRARRSCVIFNGTAMERVNKCARRPLAVASARWRPNKRPMAIAKSFAMACDRGLVDGELYFIGDVEKSYQVSHPSIKYMGSMRHFEIVNVMSMASLMIHICHIDSCPNSVVEGLRMGVPVLCNNIGGTCEVVGSSGAIVNIDEEFDFKPVADMRDVGDNSVDVDTLSYAVAGAFGKLPAVERPDLSIHVCAEKYVQEIKNAMQQ